HAALPSSCLLWRDASIAPSTSDAEGLARQCSVCARERCHSSLSDLRTGHLEEGVELFLRITGSFGDRSPVQDNVLKEPLDDALAGHDARLYCWSVLHTDRGPARHCLVDHLNGVSELIEDGIVQICWLVGDVCQCWKHSAGYRVEELDVLPSLIKGANEGLRLLLHARRLPDNHRSIRRLAPVQGIFRRQARQRSRCDILHQIRTGLLDAADLEAGVEVK